MKTHHLLLTLTILFTGALVFIANINTFKKLPVTSTESEVKNDAYAPVGNDILVDSSLSIAHQARVILIKPCGSCHQSSLPTQKAGALAVYDLDDTDNWYKEMTIEEFDGVERRLSNRDQFSEEQAAMMLEFIAFAKEEMPR